MKHHHGASPSIVRPTRTRLLLVLLLLTGPASLAAAQNLPASRFRLQEATIADVHTALAAGTLTCRQLVGLYLDRIRAYEDGGPKLNAIITVNPKALEAAAALDAQRQSSGRMGSLHCIPVLLKDNISTADMPTSVGSAILKNSVPREDAPIVTALRNAEALILGKAAMGELTAATYNTVEGQAVNPYNFKRNAGNSSGGSAAAVAANFTVLAVGGDTASSVRWPAVNNGIVGLRPTTGLISRNGIAPRKVNIDTAGPMARTVTDAARLLNVLAGPDPADPLSLEVFSQYPAGGKAGRTVRRLHAAPEEGFAERGAYWSGRGLLRRRPRNRCARPGVCGEDGGARRAHRRCETRSRLLRAVRAEQMMTPHEHPHVPNSERAGRLTWQLAGRTCRRPWRSG